MHYKPVRSRNLYDPASPKPFKLSRTRVESFMNCRRCFYIDRRLGTDVPSGPPFNLNSAVDLLLKKEFDTYRAKQEPHPLMLEAGVEAVPFQHPQLEAWRENFKGVLVHDEETNFILSGAVDDLWVNRQGELIVVDYKATSKDGEVSIRGDWQAGYRRQMEFYQWLLRRNGFEVAPTGYFVYCNARRDVPRFEGRLEFRIKLLPYKGDDRWVMPALREAKACLDGDVLPPADPECAFCAYREVTRRLGE